MVNKRTQFEFLSDVVHDWAIATTDATDRAILVLTGLAGPAAVRTSILMRSYQVESISQNLRNRSSYIFHARKGQRRTSFEHPFQGCQPNINVSPSQPQWAYKSRPTDSFHANQPLINYHHDNSSLPLCFSRFFFVR